MSKFEFDSILGTFVLSRSSSSSTNIDGGEDTGIGVNQELPIDNIVAFEEIEPEEIGDGSTGNVSSSSQDSSVGETSKDNQKNYHGLEEDFLSSTNKLKEQRLENFDKITDRQWAVVDSPETTMSLAFIVRKLVEGYGEGFTIEEIPEQWESITYTSRDPLEQTESDFAFLARLCRSKGYRMVRDNDGKKLSFVTEATGKGEILGYRIAMHSKGGDLYELDFLDKELEENPTFIIKSELNLNMTTNGGFLPQIRQYINDEGKSVVVIDTPNDEIGFLDIDYELLEEAVKKDYELDQQGKLKGERKKLYDKFNSILDVAPREDILKYYRGHYPDYNSNDKDGDGYQVFRYEGWECSFTTHGNPWVTVGEWITIQGTSSNLYFPFQIKSITHRFSHKWETDYELQR